MLDAKTVRNFITAAQEEHETRAFLEDEDVRGDVAVALVKASGITAMDLARLDLEVEDVIDVESWQYFQLAALCFQGGAYSQGFKAAVAAKTVVLVGGGMPRGWHESLEDFLEVIDPGDALTMPEGTRFIIGTEVDGDETEELAECGVVSMAPEDAVLGLVTDSDPTLPQLAGLCLAFGGVFSGPTVVVKRGFKSVTIKLGKEELLVDGKPLSERVYFAGELSGTADNAPVKALYWALLYALAGTKGDQVTGRLAFLTQLFAECDETAEVEGRTEAKYGGALGVLSLGLDPSGVISVKNGLGSDRVQALAKCLHEGIAAFPQHQVNSVFAGQGANGLAVGLEGDTVHTSAQADKKEKAINRVSSSAKKGVPQKDGSVESAFKVIIRK